MRRNAGLPLKHLKSSVRSSFVRCSSLGNRVTARRESRRPDHSCPPHPRWRSRKPAAATPFPILTTRVEAQDDASSCIFDEKIVAERLARREKAVFPVCATYHPDFCNLVPSRSPLPSVAACCWWLVADAAVCSFLCCSTHVLFVWHLAINTYIALRTSCFHLFRSGGTQPE